ncbi:hypothetical protein ACVBGC_33155 [Burkholderia stagnalis]
MNPDVDPSEYGETFDDALLDRPDGPETMVLTALRTWRRPHCDVRRARIDWSRMLVESGLRNESIAHFDRIMSMLTRGPARPFGTFCRCATTLTSDETAFLQTIALLQRARGTAAADLPGAWRARSCASELPELLRRLAADLLDAGLEIRVRDRDVTYLH